MRTIILMGTALLAACGTEAPKEAVKAAAPATLPAGQYEVTTSVTEMVSADKTPLPTFAKAGDKRTYTGCNAEGGAGPIQPTGSDADVCTQRNAYVRNGRMNYQIVCNRKGKGEVTSGFAGSYTADGFTGTLTSNSFYPGSGDYKLVEEITARKVADQCTPGAAAPKA